MLALCFLFGCVSVFSEDIIKKSSVLSLQELQQASEKHIGQTVILGGTVARVIDGNLLEIVQHPLDYRREPEYIDSTDGRFLVQFDQNIDDKQFPKGRGVTVAGEVVGKKILLFDQINYVYPLLRVREYHVWPEFVLVPMPDYHMGHGMMGLF